LNEPVSVPAPTQAVRRQVGAVRRRSNLHVVQHAIALWVAIAAAVATSVVLSALRSGRAVFALVALAGLLALCVTTALVVRHVRARWLRARDAPAHIDRARGLRGRLASVLELDALEGRDPSPFFALLVRQNVDAMPSWRAEEMVPDVVPIRAFASAIAALCALAMAVVMAPTLRPPPPHVIVGDRPMDFTATGRSHEGADRLLVAPGIERRGPHGAGSDRSADERDDEVASALAGASATLQDWLQQALGAEERWEAGEPVPANPEANPGQKGAHGPQAEHHPATTAAADDRASPSGERKPADETGPAAYPAGGSATEPGGGGPGAGAGTDSDPTLYGEPDREPVTGRDRFELGIAARVRTRRGTDMGTWSDAPAADGDRHPVLAGQQRSEEQGHRMPVPPSFAPLVRRLYAHAPSGEGDSR
jgi:hypothetical protein